jgi:hypothetical protein
MTEVTDLHYVVSNPNNINLIAKHPDTTLTYYTLLLTIRATRVEKKEIAINPIALLWNVALRALQDDLRGFANPILSEVRTPEMLTQPGRSRAQRAWSLRVVLI